MAGLSLSQLFRRYTDDGDVRALGEVFDRAAPELLTVARHLASDEAAAEDLVQATFLAAIEHPERFDPTRDLVPWLLGILANKARAARTSEARVPDPARLPGERVEDPETDAQLREFMGTLEKALERVPEAYRNVLRIHLAEGKGAEEIARELEKNSDTVRVQLHRGLRHLRRRLPAGFALGGLVVITAPKGIAAMRAQVLERASTLAGAGAAGLTTAGYTGGILMGKKIAIAVGVLVLASGAWWALRGEQGAPAEATVPEPPLTSLSRIPDESDPVIDRSQVDSPRQAVQSSSRSDVAAASDPYGALDLEWVWADGTPAAGMGVAGQSKGESQPWDHPAFGLTDENGHLTFERLHEGTIQMQTDRGCNAKDFEAAVRAGQRTSARFTVPPGDEVRGRVLDPTGRGVAGALVRVTSSMSDGGVVVAHTASDGSYSARSVDRSCNVFATADGFGGSILQSLKELVPSPTGAIPVDLTLRGDGGTIEGIVRGPEGDPIADAWVVIRCAREVQRSESLEWPSIWTATDPGGAFRIEGLHAGSADVFVDVEGYAAWTGKGSVEKSRTTTIDVRMDKGFCVEGSIVAKGGSPVANVRVSHGPTTTSLEHVWRRHQSTNTDPKGQFRLGPIPSGEVKLSAVQKVPEQISRASTTVAGRSGDVLRWDAILEEGLKIVGRVLDDSGQPVEGWRVEAGISALLDFYPTSTKTDSGGRFVLLDCADVPFRLAAYPPQEPGQRWRASAGAILDDVRPGREEVILTITRESRPSAFLFGRVVDELEQPVTGAQVSAIHRMTSQGTGTETSKDDGSFRIGPLPAGAYDVSLHRKDLPGFTLDPIEIAPEEQRDLGVIQLKARGRFELVIHREDGALVEAPFLMLLHGRYGIPLEKKDGSTFRSEELYAGSYILVPEGENIATVQQNIEIRGGETTRLDLRLPAGVLQQIRFRVPEGQTGPKYLRIVVQSSEGKVLLDRDAWTGFGREGAKETNITAGFAPGRYTVDARSDDGWGSSTSFQIEAATTETKPIEALLVRRP